MDSWEQMKGSSNTVLEVKGMRKKELETDNRRQRQIRVLKIGEKSEKGKRNSAERKRKLDGKRTEEKPIRGK